MWLLVLINGLKSKPQLFTEDEIRGLQCIMSPSMHMTFISIFTNATMKIFRTIG